MIIKLVASRGERPVCRGRLPPLSLSPWRVCELYPRATRSHLLFRHKAEHLLFIIRVINLDYWTRGLSVHRDVPLHTEIQIGWFYPDAFCVCHIYCNSLLPVKVGNKTNRPGFIPFWKYFIFFPCVFCFKTKFKWGHKYQAKRFIFIFTKRQRVHCERMALVIDSR